MAENVPNLMKTKLHIQKAQQTSRKLKSKEIHTYKHHNQTFKRRENLKIF